MAFRLLSSGLANLIFSNSIRRGSNSRGNCLDHRVRRLRLEPLECRRMLDGVPPTVLSINLHDSDPTNDASVQFDVVFSEDVTGVGTGDFALAPTGTAGGTIDSISGTGSSYTVTVVGVAGDGTLGLNLVDDDSILNVDLTPLGGAGLVNGDFTGLAYTIDNTAPTSTIAFPVDMEFYNAAGWTDAITGTADDGTGSGVAQVEVSIQQGTGNYWDGDGFDSATEVFLTATGTTTWTSAFADTNLPVDGEYAIHARATDEAGNVESGSTATFTYDTAAPTSTIEFPVDEEYYDESDWIGAITGTATDASGSGIAKVEVSVQQGTGNYWDGDGFDSATEVYLTASGTVAWIVTFADTNFPADGEYTVHARATDEAGNVDAGPSATFTFDTTAPTSTITFPVDEEYYNAASWTEAITGTATDGTGSGIALVEVSIRQGTGNYWDGDGFDSETEVYLTATGTAAWTVAFPDTNFPAEGEYTVHVWATDELGNVETGPSATFSFDTTAPTSTIAFPADEEYYNATTWTDAITGTAADTDGSGIALVEVSIRRGTGNYWDGDGFDSVTEVFTAATGTTAWSLAFANTNFSADGEYTVHARSTDLAGNVESSPSATFIYDSAAPASTTTFPADDENYNATTWTDVIDGTATDGTGSGIALVEVSIRRGSGNYWDGDGFDSATEVFVAATGTTSWSLTFADANFPAQGQYTVHARATDVAGNVETGVSTAFTFDATAPTSTLVFPAGDGVYNAASWTDAITGTAADAGGSGIEMVEASIRRGTGNYWDGDGFDSATEVFLTATGKVSWSLAFSNANFPADGEYSVHVRATDVLGNVESGSTAVFTYEATAPTATIAFPVDDEYFNATTWTDTISGTAADGSGTGIDKVEVSIRRGTGNYWDGEGFDSATEVFVTAAGTTTWSLAFADTSFPANDAYTVHARATDLAGNVDSSPTVTFTYDAAAPTVTSINRHDASPTGAASVQYDVVFSESVEGVSAGDFQLVLTGTAAGTIQSVVAVSGSAYTVTVSGVSGTGTLGLNLDNDGSIADLSGNLLAGDFTGQVYSLGLFISQVVAAERTYVSGELESLDYGVITWAVTSAETIEHITVLLDGSPAAKIFGPYGPYGDSYYYSTRIGPLSAGNHSYTIVATDSEAVSDTYTGTIVVNPAISMVAVVERTYQDGVIQSLENGIMSFAVTSSNAIALKKVRILVDGTTIGKIFGPYGPHDGHYYYSARLNPLKAGTHALTITTTDSKGLSATYTGTFKVTAAITMVAVAERPVDDGTLDASDKGITSWAVRASNTISKIVVKVDGKAIAKKFGPYGPFNGKYYYSAPFNALTAGTHRLVVLLTDSLGYSASYSGSFIVAAAPESLMVDAASVPDGGAESLTDEDLASIIVEARSRLATALGTQVAAALDEVSFQVADLPDGMLGQAAGKTIRVDDDAAGHGWFVDLTPDDDLEFVDSLGSRSLAASKGSEAELRADLLTAVMHEMGHVLGYEHKALEGDLMNAVLPLGVRRSQTAD